MDLDHSHRGNIVSSDVMHKPSFSKLCPCDLFTVIANANLTGNCVCFSTNGKSKSPRVTSVNLAPGFRLLRRQFSQPGPRRSRQGVRKQDSSYGPRGRSLGRRGQASVPANLPDRLAQSTALDIRYPMHFAYLRRNVQALRHVGTTYEPLC
ncbi:hypothetical protein TNCV_4159231 [Trichonephila clavipes]|nr:hypothetical protein TNCV_4159231 [Trichonephila clavipes]